jgi:hypothetical protein
LNGAAQSSRYRTRRRAAAELLKQHERLVPSSPQALVNSIAASYRPQVSIGAFGSLCPHASGPQHRVPTSGSVLLVFTSLTPPPFRAAS